MDPELSAAPESTAAPADFTADARREWERVFPELRTAGVLMSTDLRVLEEFCRVSGDLAQLRRAAAKVGLAESIRRGYRKLILASRQQLRQFATELGLSPSSRRGVKRGSARKEKSKTDSYLEA
jgi:P27 family predicted phage terminase small subunit